MTDQPMQPEQPDDDQPDMTSQMFVMTPHGLMSVAQMAQMHDQEHANREASAHQGVQFFESLSEEQLTTFRGILNALMHDPVSIIPYYQGITSAYLRWRFNICPACGKKHDEELHKIIEQEGGVSDGSVDKAEPPMSVEDFLENMRIWNVTFLHSDDDRPLGVRPLKCLADCGATFPNLADRMLRKPGHDGCPGCIQKSKTG